MADPVFLVRIVAASLVATVLLLDGGNSLNASSVPADHATGRALAGK